MNLELKMNTYSYYRFPLQKNTIALKLPTSPNPSPLNIRWVGGEEAKQHHKGAL